MEGNNRANLGEFLNKIRALEVGETLRSQDFDFSVFALSSHLGALFERKDKRLLRHLDLKLWRRRRENIEYNLSSDGESRLILSGDSDFRVAGAE